jgi:hypothetical protein
MATEVLVVPEDNLREVIRIIRAGLKATSKERGISKETRRQLTKWCNDEAQYLDECEETQE